MREHVETSIENMYYVNEWLDDGRLQKRHVINMQVNYEKSTLKMDHSTMYVPCANCLLSAGRCGGSSNEIRMSKK